MSKKVTLKLNFDQVCMLRAVIHEYYSKNDFLDDAEESTYASLEDILADAENSAEFEYMIPQASSVAGRFYSK